MAAVLRHWREASTLILITARRKGSADIKPEFVSSHSANGGQSYKSKPRRLTEARNLDVLLLKRSAKSRFMPNTYVFPGGVASDVDFSAEWISVFDSLGKDHRQKLFDFAQRGGPGSPMFSRLREEQFSHVPSEIAFRICAIRETFEESGVLIARRTGSGNGGGSNPSPSASPWAGATWASYIDDEAIITEWRHRVNEDPQEFLRMCQELAMVPDVWSLYEWSNWLTPLLSKRRFDTAFYICCVQDAPHVAEDEGETVHSQWANPYDILYEYYRGKVGLPPPQVYEILRLLNFGSAQELLQFSWRRGQHRVERWLPVPVAAADGIVIVYPGDSLFPKNVDPEGPAGGSELDLGLDLLSHTSKNGKGPAEVYEQTLAQLDLSHPNKNRNVYLSGQHQPHGLKCVTVQCNIALPGDHVSPVDISDSELFNGLSSSSHL